MIAILTTKSLHHIYYVKKIYSNYKNIITILEKKTIKPSFNTNVDFEKKRILFEKKKIKKEFKKINFLGKVYSVDDINSKKVLKIIKTNKIKYLFVFGTKKINLKLFKTFKNKFFNFHGGDPERYRGLDSHYWAIYHNDFNSIKVCMHKIDKKLDTGEIVFIKKISIKENPEIYKLRFVCTKIYINFTKKLIKIINKKKMIKSIKQKKTGRYYSFMPTALKILLEKKIKKHILNR